MCDHEEHMKEAIAIARKGIDDGQTPFGACIVKDGKVIALGHNNVWEDLDITAHAEVVAIRRACKALGSIDLSGCTIYSTCEPCPMCFSAIHWAKIEMIVFGAFIRDAANSGFRELHITNEKMNQEGGAEIIIVEGVLKDECLALFELWKGRSPGMTY